MTGKPTLTPMAAQYLGWRAASALELKELDEFLLSRAMAHDSPTLQAATERNRQLETENRAMREALALALGEQPVADLPGRLGETPKKKSSAAIGPC